MPVRQRRRWRVPRALVVQTINVEDLEDLAQASFSRVGFILIDFWSFCAMRTEPNVCLLNAVLSERRKAGSNTVSIANESDQVTKGHLVDALAVRGEEGRGTLR